VLSHVRLPKLHVACGVLAVVTDTWKGGNSNVIISAVGTGLIEVIAGTSLS
jgi:hypothetical protein